MPKSRLDRASPLWTHTFPKARRRRPRRRHFAIPAECTSQPECESQHNDFDRIIYEFGSTHTPSWRAEYVAEATPRGQTIWTQVDGRSILQIYFFGTTTSSTEAVTGYEGPNPLRAPEGGAVSEVHLPNSFLDTTQSFVGIRNGHSEFQVSRLTDPARITVDIEK